MKNISKLKLIWKFELSSHWFIHWCLKSFEIIGERMKRNKIEEISYRSPRTIKLRSESKNGKKKVNVMAIEFEIKLKELLFLLSLGGLGDRKLASNSSMNFSSNLASRFGFIHQLLKRIWTDVCLKKVYDLFSKWNSGCEWKPIETKIDGSFHFSPLPMKRGNHGRLWNSEFQASVLRFAELERYRSDYRKVSKKR